MRRAIDKERAEELRKFSKEQIIAGILSCGITPGVDMLIAEIKYIEQQDLILEQEAAANAEQRAFVACMNWRREMCDKYGGGVSPNVSDIPPKERQRGADLKRAWDAARAKEKRITARLNKSLGVTR